MLERICTLPSHISLSTGVASDHAGLPLVISFGGDIDSTALLLMAIEQGIKVDHILFANIGPINRSIFRYVEAVDRWCADSGLPRITEICGNTRHSPGPDSPILHKRVRSSLRYSKKQKPTMWAIKAKELYLKKLYRWNAVGNGWPDGFDRIIRWVGYSVSPRNEVRARAVDGWAAEGFLYRFPLMEAGIDHSLSNKMVQSAGLLRLPADSASDHLPRFFRPFV